MNAPTPAPAVVLVHGAWADGSSWSRVITDLQQAGIAVTAARIPLTSLAEDVAALNRVIDRTSGPVVVAAHAYAGAVIAAAEQPRVRGLVFIAALAPDQGETVADVFYRDDPHPEAPQLKPDADGWIWLPAEAFPTAFPQQAGAEETKKCWRPCSVRSRSSAFGNRYHDRAGKGSPLGISWPNKTG